MSNEIWAVIPGWDAYEVSSMGRVRNIRTGHILSQNKDKDGYLRLNLSMSGRRRNWRVHMLVMLAFVGPPPEDRPQVAHWDGDESNNKLGNLRYATVVDNCLDKHRHGRMPVGMKSPLAKISDETAIQIFVDRYQGGFSIRELAEKYGASHATVQCVIYKERRFSRLTFPEIENPIVRWSRKREARTFRKPRARGATRVGGRWQAQIGVCGKTIYLGLFDDEQSARDAYRKKRDEIENSYTEQTA